MSHVKTTPHICILFLQGAEYFTLSELMLQELCDRLNYNGNINIVLEEDVPLNYNCGCGERAGGLIEESRLVQEVLFLSRFLNGERTK